MRHTRLYRDGVLEAKDFPAAQISDYLDEPGTVVWLDLCEPDRADLEAHGVGFLLWGLLDVVVDGHFATVQQLDEAIEGLEDLLFDERPHGAEVQRRSFELRKSLVVLRRLVLPMREVVNTLLRRDLGL